MLPTRLQIRLRALIDALIREENPEASFLASVLLSAQQAVEAGETTTFALRVWQIANGPETEPHQERGLPACRTSKQRSRRRRAG